MTLLEEIQAELVDPKGDLGSMLRKCKLLAARLGSKPLEDWLVWESNGYPSERELPDYRTWPLEVRGHFSGPFGSSMRNVIIPALTIPEGVRDTVSTFQCRQSIASIEQSLRDATDSTLT